jgi:stage II sporulation protein AA (anti-sigma F factor antagonist)
VIERSSADGCDTFALGGELDLTNAGELEVALHASVAARVVLDVGGLDYLDSAGIRAIDNAHRRLVAEGRSLRLVAPEGSRAAWTFRVAGFPEQDGSSIDLSES